MQPTSKETIGLRFVFEGSVPGVMSAIQVGKGSEGKPITPSRTQGQTHVIECQIALTRSADGKPVPAGDLVQRDSKGLFVYVLWGTSAGEHGSPWTRRAKVYLD